MSEKDGGPAFPGKSIGVIYPQNSTPEMLDQIKKIITPTDGMSLRDYFAGQAIKAYISIKELSIPQDPNDMIAEGAYALADAMLKARKK